MTAAYDSQFVTGLILAGGRGSRMGGVDKGLQNHNGMPMALHAMMRLSPQVLEVMVNANRNLTAYESFGASVWPDSTPDFAGPLAGMLTGLEHTHTPWMVTVPCDCPVFPLDLVERLYEAVEREAADLAMPVTTEADGRRQTHPVFCLMRASLLENLAEFLARGGRKIDAWTQTQRCVEVPFPDAQAFFNVNTAEDLRRLG